MCQESIVEQSLIAKSTAKSDQFTPSLMSLKGVGTSPQAGRGAKIDNGRIIPSEWR